MTNLKSPFEILPEFPAISERIATRDFSLLSCPKKGYTFAQQQLPGW
jgi:hypothetical protein